MTLAASLAAYRPTSIQSVALAPRGPSLRATHAVVRACPRSSRHRWEAVVIGTGRAAHPPEVPTMKFSKAEIEAVIAASPRTTVSLNKLVLSTER